MSKLFRKRPMPGHVPAASPAEVQAALQQAVALHQRGQLVEAEQLYRDILKVTTDHFDATRLLGIILLQRHQLVEGEQLIARALQINPNDPSTLYNRGNALRDLKRIEDALASYDKAIALKPDYADAFYNRGLVLQELKRFDEALASYEKAIGFKPTYAAAFLNRGVVLKELRRFDEALASYDKAIAVKPDYADVFNSRGNALQELKRFDEGLASYDKAIALKPDYVEAFNNRGNALQELKRFDEALASYDKTLALKPDYADAFNNRGNALGELKRFDEALASYDKAIALKPDYAEAFYNQGNALQELKRFEEGLASYDKAITLKPDYAAAFYNRGNALKELNQFDEAPANYDKAIALKPDYAEAFNNRGVALQKLKRFDEALASYDKAIALKPDYADGHWGRADLELLVGRYKEGWADYEWRWEAKDFPSKRPNIKVPTWRGEDLAGRHLLVFSEQGMGDVIQFARYLPLLVERKCRISFFAPANLSRLLRPSIQPVEIVSELKGIHEIDFQIALMSLPQRFNTELSSIPHKVPYLTAEPELDARWRARLGTDGFKVGIAWQGNPRGKIDEGRSVPLEQFIPLSRVPGVRLISLQKHVGLEQLARLPRDVTVETLGDAFDNGPDAFIDAAAVMNSLDLIITSDTSIAHLAGALGRPTWVALKHAPDWRWLLDREDSPWYPTLRLFRQPQRDDWTNVFAKIQQELKLLLNKKSAHINQTSSGTPTT